MTGVVFAFQYLRLPAVVGLLVAGVLMGPSGLSLVRDVERVRVLAEIGVVVLLFAVGLEFPLSRLWGMLPLMLKVGLPQVLVCGAVTALAVAWHFQSFGPTLFAGMLVATILGVCLIPMLYVVVEKLIGGAKKPAPAPAATPPLAADHGHGGH